MIMGFPNLPWTSLDSAGVHGPFTVHSQRKTGHILGGGGGGGRGGGGGGGGEEEEEKEEKEESTKYANMGVWC